MTSTAWSVCVTHRAVLRFIMGGGIRAARPSRSIMKNDVVTITPDTPTIEALRIMRRLHIGCLPVVHDDRLVGIVTEEDFMEIATKLLEEQMGITDQLPLPLELEPETSDQIENPATSDKPAKK